MSVGALIEELERLGVKLHVTGSDLEYGGPEKAMTPELLERLKVHKTDLMVIYSQSEAVAEEDRASAEIACMQTAGGSASRRLLTAGWKPKGRCGKVIWKCPDNNFYYSRQIGLHLLNQKEHIGQERGNRKEGTQRGGDC